MEICDWDLSQIKSFYVALNLVPLLWVRRDNERSERHIHQIYSGSDVGDFIIQITFLALKGYQVRLGVVVVDHCYLRHWNAYDQQYDAHY